MDETALGPKGLARRVRHRQVVEVLARHGLGYLVGQLGLERLVPLPRGLGGHPLESRPHAQAKHVRMALEDLGPAFVKLGQLLSTRADLVPPEYRAELAKLLDQAPPIPGEEVAAVIEAELGEPPDRVFASFDPEPLAAASIGQAHLARAHDGAEVVVKVRRPGVVKQVEEDLLVIEDLARIASRHASLSLGQDLEGLAAEFATVLRSELDYVREGESADRFAHNFAGFPGLHIPMVLWETSTHRVLTLERITGIRIDDLSALDRAEIDRHELALRAAHVILKMVFEDGFFHADPHPGNLFVEPGGRIGLIDFGMVGSLDPPTQSRLADLMGAIVAADAERLADTFLELGTVHGFIDRVALGQDLGRLVGSYSGRPLGELPIEATIREALDVARRHRIVLPINLSLLFKTLVMEDGLGRTLDPTFQLATVMAPFARRLRLRSYQPRAMTHRIRESGADLAALLERSPRQIRHLLDDMERGGFEVGVRPVGFQDLVSRLDRAANRVALAVLGAGYVVGLAVLMTLYQAAGWQRWVGAAFVAGFVVAVGIVAYLAWATLRGSHGHRDPRP